MTAKAQSKVSEASQAKGAPCLDIAYGGYSIAGVKEENQDAFAAFQPELATRHLKGAAVCIADGVSSSAKAQLASQTSVTHFIEEYYSTPDTWEVKTAVTKVLQALNDWLYHHGQHVTQAHHSDKNTMLTTLSGMVFKSNTAHLFHIGDSRIYRLRDGELLQLTRDHSQRAGPDREFLTRALGMDNHLEVDYRREEVYSNDLWILTTDGVHDVLSKPQLQALIAAEHESLEAKAKEIVETALAAGSQDNLSCLFAQVQQLPKEDINEVHRSLTQLAIPPVMDIGNKIDGYEVLRVLHSGTRSHLYLVKHPDQAELRVLKTPSENFSEDPGYLEGFIREQWVGLRIDNPGVMKMLPRPEGSPFLYHLCEYIEGQTLREWMFDHPEPSLNQVRDITKGIISSLRALHRLGMLHRDLKPENVMLDENGQVKIIDFGTVHVSGLAEIHSQVQEDCPVGSVNYIAPEYLAGQACTMQSDLFSLGVMVYEMLTGTLPYQVLQSSHYDATRKANWSYKRASDVRQDIPQWMNLCLEKALAPNPADRYPAFSEFLHDLCTPNETMVERIENAPLIERSPVRFWQLVSVLLLAVVVLQWLYFL